MYTIKYKERVAKFLEKLDRETANRVFNKLESLKEDPFPHGSIKVSGKANSHRIRIGNYRALYTVYKGEGIITITKVDKREGFYDRI